MWLKLFAILSLVGFCSIVESLGQCEMLYNGGTDNRPRVVKTIGSRQVVIRNSLVSSLRWQNGEQISVQCDNGFESPTNLNQQSKEIDLICERGNILVNSEYVNYNSYGNIIAIACNTLKWNLYESSTQFSWCPPPMESYTLAKPTGVDSYKFLGGICYNFEDMSIQSMHYVLAPEASKHLTHQLMFREYKPSTKIENIADYFVAQELNAFGYDDPQMQKWMEFAKYENHLLIQNSNGFHGAQLNLGGMLDIAWWSGLRLGNWQLYEEALSKHIETAGSEYDILAGVSGTVSAPIYKQSCHTNRTMVELVDNKHPKMPLYVWHYLKSTRHQSDNVVVIGVNSPFYEFYAKKDLVFCKDICPQIDWLQEVHSTFHYKTMGVVFCCSVDEVKAAKRLNNFPASPKPIIRTLPPPLTMLTFKPAYDVMPEEIENEYDDDGHDANSSETDY